MNSNFVFGPVPSRRLGYSLGIDLMPHKVCSYNCVYCQVGRTERLTIDRFEYGNPSRIVTEIEEVIKNDIPVDWVTFSGQGEPTLNRYIGRIIREIKSKTDLPVAVITNGSLLFKKEVREAIKEAELVIPSLDTAIEATFKKINRPHPRLHIDMVIEGLEKFIKEFSGKIWLEILFVKGLNDTLEEINALKKKLRDLPIHKIQLNTATRPPSEDWVTALSEEELVDISRELGDRCEVIARFKKKKVYKRDIEDVEDLKTYLRRRPATKEEIKKALGWSEKRVLAALDLLLSRNSLKKEVYREEIYYHLL